MRILHTGCVAGINIVFLALVLSGWDANAQDLSSRVAELENQFKESQTNSDHIWTMIAAFIVFLMQGGFLLLEAGLVRSKNSINVAQKNLADFFLSSTFFYIIGFNLMYGATVGGWFGWSSDYYSLGESSGWDHTFFVYQIVFCGAAATIVSGALAERIKFEAYLITAIFVSIAIYPLFGHWAWGDKLTGVPTLLTALGYMDYAGSSVVSAIGGWSALAGLFVIGVRIGKYNEDGSINHIQGHSLVLAAFGALVLWVGWLAFNTGLAHAGSGELAHIVSNTLLGGAFGGLTGLILGRFYDGVFRPERSIFGALGGLVAITAGCDVLPTYGAIICGIVAGFLVLGATWLMEYKLKLDDAICAVPVHGVCGTWAVIALAIFAPEEKLLAGSRIDQLEVQLIGAALAFFVAFGLSYIFFRILDAIMGLRVCEAWEKVGLNTAEHGATLGTGLLQEALMDIVQGKGDLTQRLDETTGDESAEIAHLFNRFIGNIQKLMRGLTQNAHTLSESSKNLSQISTYLASSSEEVTAQAKQVAGSSASASKDVDEIAETVKAVTASVTSISANATQMSSNMKQVSNAISEMTEAITDISKNAYVASDISSRAQELALNAAQTMKTLEQATHKIGDIVSFIKKIAGQTNMLALNATVEAAKAGESGKGFAVVAGEVKSLAKQTAKATEDITRAINDIQSGSNDAMSVIDEVETIIETINTSISGISAAVEEQSNTTAQISQNVDETSASAESIALSISDVAKGAQTMSDSVSNVAKEVRQVTDNIEGFAQEARASSQQAQKVKDTSKSLTDISKNLEDSISDYKID